MSDPIFQQNDHNVRRQLSRKFALGVSRRDLVIADTSFANSVALNTLYSVNVPNADMNGHALRLTLGGTYLNNSGGNSNLALRVELNGKAGYRAAGLVIAAAATSRAWKLVVEITARNTTVQELLGHFSLSDATAPIAGVAPIAVTNLANNTFEATGAEDTSDETLTTAITVLFGHSVAAATISITTKTAILERI
jgi:hypothetical protein